MEARSALPDTTTAVLSYGSPAYAPPEYHRREPGSPASDLFCLAASLDDLAGRAIGDTDIHQHHFAKLKTRLDGLGDDVARAPRDQSRRMLSIARARVDHEIWPVPTRNRDHALGGVRIIHGHHQRRRLVDAEAAQHLRPGGVTKENASVT